MRFRFRFAVQTLVVTACIACSRVSEDKSADQTSSGTSFAAMQQRGKMAMGVDQTTSTHTFDALPDGGRIVLLRDAEDTVAVAQIRAHLRLIQHAFQAGDFSTSQFVHMQSMPGTAEMARKRDGITYSYHELPRGGEVVMKTADAEALGAIHAFMGAQRSAHHAGGMGSVAPP